MVPTALPQYQNHSYLQTEIFHQIPPELLLSMLDEDKVHGRKTAVDRVKSLVKN